MLSDNNVCASIAVKDMAAATKFYGETLGLEATMETPGGTFFKSGSSAYSYIRPSMPAPIKLPTPPGTSKMSKVRSKHSKQKA